jgi:beta-aspartyl-peptidase (threonine type)
MVHAGVSEKVRSVKDRLPTLDATILAVKAGYQLLLEGKSAIDAVERAVNVMESSGATNSGKGSVLQTDGRQRMDATIMDSKLNCGAVASMRGFENPISIARYIMDRQDGHYFYAQDFASELALAHGGFKLLKEKPPNTISNIISEIPEGNTVGSVAFDGTDGLAAGTSTGGRGQCAAGRIGDSAIIGAGTYCNSAAAVSNTGHGEWIVKLNCAKSVVDLIQKQQLPPQVAVDQVGREYKAMNDKTLGTICVNTMGEWGILMVGGSMHWALIHELNNGAAELIYGCGKGEVITQLL